MKNNSQTNKLHLIKINKEAITLNREAITDQDHSNVET